MYRNKDFKLKLIFPCRFEIYNSYPYSASYIYYPPYGMGVLASFLRQNNFYVEQEDLDIRFNPYDRTILEAFSSQDIDLDIAKYNKEIHSFLKSGEMNGKLSLLIDKTSNSTSIEGFDVIGFSVLSFYHFLFALILSKKLKQRTTAPIVFGGPFISLFGHLYSNIFNSIDYMIVGDGRIPLLRLIDYLNHKISISEVPNLIYREDGKLVTNSKESYPIEDIPIPDFSDLPLKLYRNRFSSFSGYDVMLPYQITRGCVSRCNFCTYRYIDDKIEFKSYDKVISELKHMKGRYKSKMFLFWDSTINNSYKYLEGLCDSFIKNRLNINWNVFAKVGNLDKHILRKMKDAGCNWLVFGIESGSNRLLSMMNKGFTSEQSSQTLRDAYEVGIKNSISLITGYPYEIQEDINQTVEFIKRNRRYMYDVQIYRFELKFGSLIYFNPENYGITNLVPNYSNYISTFDESNGLQWEQKLKQQEDSKRQIIKAVHKNVRFKWKLKIFLVRYFILLRHIILKIKRVCHFI